MTASDSGYCYTLSAVVGRSVCLSVSDVRKPCENVRTDRDAV